MVMIDETTKSTLGYIHLLILHMEAYFCNYKCLGSFYQEVEVETQ